LDNLKIDKVNYEVKEGAVWHKMVHHIESINKEMFTIKEVLRSKSKKRAESLKKAQKKFKNISTNFKGMSSKI